MRLWSLHPHYLDPQGLVALWREALLAQKVLEGKTVGYTNHPQLIRFRYTNRPLDAIRTYLDIIADEADRRGYRFQRMKIGRHKRMEKHITVTRGQLTFEKAHLLRKLQHRAPHTVSALTTSPRIRPHPLFMTCRGAVEPWEKQ